MTAITKGAIRAIKFYKHVVQSVEKFIQKVSFLFDTERRVFYIKTILEGIIFCMFCEVVFAL